MPVAPEAVAVAAFCDFLRAELPAKVTSLNAARFAVLKAGLVGPYTIPSGGKLKLSAVGPEATPVECTLTSGSRTAAQVASDINGTVGVPLTASADADGRLVLTSPTAPTASLASVACVALDATATNVVLGWETGGEREEVAALVAPGYRGVVDGRPLVAPDMGNGFWVLLGNRTAKPTHPGIRRDTYLVTITTELWRPFGANATPHRSREAISSCVRAVREVVCSDTGRYLGRDGDVQLADATEATIFGDPLALREVSGVLFDVARLTLTCRVFQRPS